MDFAQVDVEVRTQSGKSGAHKVRAAGKVPGVLYGHKQPPVLIEFDERTLLKSMDKEKRRNTVFVLKMNGGAQSETVMIREAQIHPISRRLVHLDFLRVSLEDEVHVTVPLVLTGRAVGLADGGQLHQNVHELRVAAKPAAIPTKIEVDVTPLKIGDALHVGDLKLATGLRALHEATEALASVVAPRAEKVAATTEAAPVEGAAPAAGAAKPGEGDKAAAAPAKKDDKKK
jgi:large subunit ribosomal protein L25